MPFISNTKEQQRDMLAAIGLTMDKLFSDIPKELRADEFNLPKGLTEHQCKGCSCGNRGQKLYQSDLLSGWRFLRPLYSRRSLFNYFTK